MKVSPVEVHDLYNEGLSVSEIARRLKISRALVNLKLREYDLDNLERELNEEKVDLEAREAKAEAREREINKIPELEERAHSLESKAHLLNSEVDSLTKESNELEETIRSKKEVLEEIKEYDERREEMRNQLSELSNRVDLQRRSAKKLDETQKQIEIERGDLRCIEYEIYMNREENMRLVDRLPYTCGGLATKTKIHEEIRKKLLQDMEIIAKEAKIIKPDLESDLQALLRESVR